MIIRKMTACFGRLKNETLELHEGLNVVELPNEAGKSTWTEFLLAMLYGVDTAERRTKGVIPIKEKYRPWDGGEMSGLLELETDGRRITLERSGSLRAPMAKLNAYETGSGVPAPLDASDCGRTLLHAERSVYERSGFIRQQQLTVTQDAALEQKLAALVTTGDETLAFSHVEQALRDLKNHCKHNKTGLIPDTEQQLAEAQTQLAQVYREQEAIAQAEAERQTLLGEQAELRRARAVLEALDSQRKLAQVQAAETALREAEEQLSQAQTQCALLPPPDTLRTLQSALERVEGDRRAQAARQDYLPPLPAAPTLPPALQGTPREAFSQKAAADLERCRALAETPRHAKPWALLGGLVGIAAAIALALLLGGALRWLAALPFALGVGLLVLGFFQRRRVERGAAEADAALDRLLRSYGASEPEELPRLAETAEQALAQQDEALAARQATLDRFAAEQTQTEQELAALLAQVDSFGVKTDDPARARQGVQAALAAYDTRAACLERVAQRHAALEQLRALAEPAQPVSEEDAARYGHTDALQVAAALGRCQARLTAVQTQLDTANGRLSAMGDSLALEAQIERSQARLRELEQKNAAIVLAMDTLREANADLQSRFAPLVCEQAAEIFSRLTGGRYARVLLSQDLSVSVAAADSPVSRMLQLLSAGTVDQLYLALRLAISRLLLPDAPLVLDDALVAFDDARAKNALQVLQEEAAHRQILLFTCQTREARLLG